MARYDARNTGHSKSGLSGCPEMQWRYRFIEDEQSVENVMNGPAVADGRVYLPTTRGLRVLDARTGEIRWRGEGYTYVSPVVIGDTCWFAVDGADAGTIRAIDTNSYQSRWSHQMPGLVRADLTVTNGTVLVGTDDGTVSALDAKTGRVRWEFESEFTGRQSRQDDQARRKGFQGAPAVEGGRVYAPCQNGTLYVLDAKTGEEIWRFGTTWRMRNAVAVGDGRVHIANANDLFTLDKADGSIQWEMKKDRALTTQGAPALANGMVYQMAGNALVDIDIRAFDAATGERQWMQPIPYPSDADPCVVNGRVYVGAGEYHAFDAATGEKRWAVETATAPYGMAFTDEAAYLAAFHGLYAVQ
jgi:outer membrane protein assembly factor BamB